MAAAKMKRGVNRSETAAAAAASAVAQAAYHLVARHAMFCSPYMFYLSIISIRK